MFKFSYLKIWIFISPPVMTCSEAVWLPWVPFNFSSTENFQGSVGATEPQTRQSVLLTSGATSPHRDTSLPQASQPHLIHLYWRWTKRCLGNLSLKISGVWPPWSSWLWHFLWFLRGLPSCLWFQYHTSIIWYHRLKPKPRELVSILNLDITRIYPDITE